MPRMTILAWQRGGSGHRGAVVLLHGWAADGPGTFGRSGLADALGRAGYDVLVPDLPGHGDSADVLVPPDADPAAWTAGIVIEDLDELRVQELRVVGHAQGALVAGHLASRHPARATPLVLLSADDRVGLTGGAQVAALLRGDRSGLWDAEAAEVARRAGADGRHHPPTLADWVERASWPAAPRLGALRTPVLLALGSADERRHRAPRLAQLFHDARLVTVPGDGGSMLAAEELHEALVAFLKEHEE
jgi:pimeloyl-ACP methyl ester carboxylesterase